MQRYALFLISGLASVCVAGDYINDDTPTDEAYHDMRVFRDSDPENAYYNCRDSVDSQGYSWAGVTIGRPRAPTPPVEKSAFETAMESARISIHSAFLALGRGISWAQNTAYNLFVNPPKKAIALFLGGTLLGGAATGIAWSVTSNASNGLDHGDGSHDGLGPWAAFPEAYPTTPWPTVAWTTSQTPQTTTTIPAPSCLARNAEKLLVEERDLMHFKQKHPGLFGTTPNPDRSLHTLFDEVSRRFRVSENCRQHTWTALWDRPISTMFSPWLPQDLCYAGQSVCDYRRRQFFRFANNKISQTKTALLGQAFAHSSTRPAPQTSSSETPNNRPESETELTRREIAPSETSPQTTTTSTTTLTTTSDNRGRYDLSCRPQRVRTHGEGATPPPNCFLNMKQMKALIQAQLLREKGQNTRFTAPTGDLMTTPYNLVAFFLRQNDAYADSGLLRDLPQDQLNPLACGPLPVAFGWGGVPIMTLLTQVREDVQGILRLVADEPDFTKRDGTAGNLIPQTVLNELFASLLGVHERPAAERTFLGQQRQEIIQTIQASDGPISSTALCAYPATP